MGVIALCESAAPATPLPTALGEIFLTLAAQAEHEIRRQLSERLAHADWAPPALIDMLALDEIDIAAPVIAAGSKLDVLVSSAGVDADPAFAAETPCRLRSVHLLFSVWA